MMLWLGAVASVALLAIWLVVFAQALDPLGSCYPFGPVSLLGNPVLPERVARVEQQKDGAINRVGRRRTSR